MATTVRIIFYSTYGHIYRMAEAAAEAAGQITGATAELYQVPELVPEVALQRSGEGPGGIRAHPGRERRAPGQCGCSYHRNSDPFR